MALIKIHKEAGVHHIFIASDNISDLATVEIVPGLPRYVAMGSTTNPHLAAGVARGTTNSGQLIDIITQGFVSGVICAAAVQAGDRFTIATSGRVTPLNTIALSGTGGGLVSGVFKSGLVLSGNWGLSGLITSGYATVNISSQFTIGRMLGKALSSGGAGSGIQAFICLE